MDRNARRSMRPFSAKWRSALLIPPRQIQDENIDIDREARLA